MFLNKISLIVNVLVVQQTMTQSLPYGMNWAFPNSLSNMRNIPFMQMLGDDMQFSQMPGNRMPFTQITGSGIPYTPYKTLSNGMSSDQISRNSIPFTQMTSNSMPFTQMPINAMPFTQMPAKNMPFTQMLSNDMPIVQLIRDSIPFTQMPSNAMPFTQIPAKNMPFTQMLGNSNGMPYTQMPGINWNPLDYRQMFEDLQSFNNIYMPNFIKKQNVNGLSNLPLNAYQALTLNNLIGIMPYNSLGFIDEETHVAGISIPSTYTIIRNPYLQDISVSTVFGNKFGMPYMNSLPMTGTSRLDSMSNILGGRNLLNLYF